MGVGCLDKSLPDLYDMYAKYSEKGSGKSSGSVGINVPTSSDAKNAATSQEVVEIFKDREDKLVRFSQAIIDITSDLLGAIEIGDALDQTFLTTFKRKFDFFREALPVLHEAQPHYKSRTPPSLSVKARERDRDRDRDRDREEGRSASAATALATSRRHRHAARSTPGELKNKRRKKVREIDVHSLKFEEIVSDLYSKVHEVENFLIECTEDVNIVTPHTTHDSILEPSQATKMKYAITAAMSASSLACTLAHIIVRPDKEDHTEQSRDSVVAVLVRNDILGIVKRCKRRASIERMEPDTSNWAQLIATSMRNEGVVGFIEALRCFLPVKSRMYDSLAVSLSHSSHRSRGRANDDTSKGELKLEKNSTVVFLEASQCLCESLYRLIVAIGSTPIGRQYLHTSGTELTSHTTKLLIQLPSDFSFYDPKTSTAVFSEGVIGQSYSMDNAESCSIGNVDSCHTGSHNGSLSERRNTNFSDTDTNPASSLRLWCILALTVLAATSGSADSDIQNTKNAAKKDNLQLLIVEDGALEWLNQAFFSLLMEILAAAFASNSKVTREAVGNDSVAIGMAALSLDAKRQSQSRVNTSRSATDDSSITTGPFTISSATFDVVPQELLVLLDLCLGMLLFAARSQEVQKILTSTPAFQEISRSLLKTLLRLLLLPQLTQALADGILVILNVLFKDQIQFRQLARDLKDIAVLEKKIAIGGLKWFSDTKPLQKLLQLIGSNSIKRTGPNDLISASNLRILAESNKWRQKATGRGGSGGVAGTGSGPENVVTSLADIALGKVMVTQTHASDNTQLLEFLSRQKSYTGKVNASSLVRYEDFSKASLPLSEPAYESGFVDLSNSPTSARYKSTSPDALINAALIMKSP